MLFCEQNPKKEIQEWELVGKSMAVGSQSRIESRVVNSYRANTNMEALSLQQPGARAGPMMAQPPYKKNYGATHVNMPEPPNSPPLWQTTFYQKGDEAKLKISTTPSRGEIPCFTHHKTNMIEPTS